MHLKSLTLKGFKSFASATTLRFEPGITVVVGPNGSGKSNIVDAVAWVLGEQGAKALRGGKMDDVIFAGTADRPPLGRAEVTLTIDNSDGALPIGLAEVTITRRMFRDGVGEYEINGKACRLLDVQELLSDSGIGREMHVIVSQGQLDSVLSARPEDRRAFIEEAAGVLKHRRRKEKALRKLDAMQVNLTRLTDLTAELRRQLGPLGRQAEVARRAVGVQADLRDARLRLLADDVAALQAAVAADAVAERTAVERRSEIAARLAAAQADQDGAAGRLAAAAPAVARAQTAHFALSALAERFRGTVSLAAERARNLAAPQPSASSGRDPEELDRAADQAEQEHAEKDRSVQEARSDLAAAVEARTDREAAAAAAEAALLAASRALADRREGLARLVGQVNTARSRLAAAEEEIDRLGTAIGDATGRARAAQAQFDELRGSIGDLDSSEVGLDTLHEAAASAAAAAAGRVAELTEAQRAATSAQSSLRARVDALAMGLDRRDGAGALLAATDELPGVLGSISTLLDVSPGAEAAIAAALGTAADAVAVADLSGATAALELLKRRDAGRAGLVVGRAPRGERIPEGASAGGPGNAAGGPATGPKTGPKTGPAWAPPGSTAPAAGPQPEQAEQPAPPARSEPPDAPEPPPGTQWALDLVRAPEALADSLRILLEGVVVVDDLVAAAGLVHRQPQLRAVTRGGDLVGAGWVFGGSAGRQSVIEIQAAVDDAEEQLAAVTASLARVDRDLAAATAQAQQRAAEAERSLAALYESDAKMAAIAEQLGRLGEATRSAEAEAERLAKRREAAAATRQDLQYQVADLQSRLAAAEADVPSAQLDPAGRDQLAAAAAAARQHEVDARLVLRTAEERARVTAGAAEDLRRAAAQERAARARAREVAALRAAGAAVAERIVALGERAAARLASSVAAAATARAEAEADRGAAEQAAVDARRAATALQAEWDSLTDSVHAAEVLRAQQRLRLEQFAEAAAAEYAMNLTDLVAEFGPAVPVPPSAAELAEYQNAKERGEGVSAPAPMPFDRPSTLRRAKRAERDLALLGRVNPLALEEFAAMEERHAFLSTQLEDLRGTRKDLLAVVAEVDQKILQLFESAYHDVAAEFEKVFATLFPGGEGRLVLTDPSDMLMTGVDVTARPPGKKVKRLSLLSGGERALVAVAMLVAIFRARPSPFYVLDEIEAALDEINLARLIDLLHELRSSSQLLVITHQKYTMEAGDVLYGVSMRGDGITEVISQRIRSRDGVPAAQRDQHDTSS